MNESINGLITCRCWILDKIRSEYHAYGLFVCVCVFCKKQRPVGDLYYKFLLSLKMSPIALELVGAS